MKLQFYIEEMKMKQYYMHLKEYSKYQEKILKKLYGKTTKANQRFSDIVNLVRPLTKEDKEIIFKTLQEETDCFLTFNEVTIMFELLQNLIPLDIYKNLFQVILTDNGHEFFDVNNI